MAKIEIDPPKKIEVSNKLQWFFVFVILAQLALFAFGFYRNLKPQTKIEYREKTILVSAPSAAPETATPEPQRPLRTVKPFPQLQPLPAGFGQSNAPAFTPQNQFTFDPVVLNPLEERLLKDARAARVKSDMRAVALKLGEALTEFPESVHAHYQLADMYEAMGIFDKAIEHYEEVYSFGISQAGPLYKIAAQKLLEGFYKEQNYGELMAIGTVHQFQNPEVTQGQAITITIPILAAPTLAVDPDQVSISVQLFDKEGTRVVTNLRANDPEQRWSNPSPDWRTNGEEFLVIDYYIPDVNSDAMFQSLEPRKYYGYLVELYYKGELLDQLAWPRTLSNKIAGQSGNELFDFSFEDVYEEINLSNPLLPLPEN